MEEDLVPKLLEDGHGGHVNVIEAVVRVSITFIQQAMQHLNKDPQQDGSRKQDHVLVKDQLLPLVLDMMELYLQVRTTSEQRPKEQIH